MQPELWVTGPEHSGQTRIWLLINGLVTWYRVGRSWGLVGAVMVSSGSVAMAWNRRYTEDWGGARRGRGGGMDGIPVSAGAEKTQGAGAAGLGC